MGESSVIETTQKVMKLFKDNGIDCWIIGGVLLRLYRGDDVSKLDDDIDLGFFMKDKEKVLNFLSTWVIVHRWDKVAVMNYKGCQVDMFFCDEDDNNIYLYAYYSDASTKYCNIEWRAKYPKETHLPLRDYTFKNGITLTTPNNIERVLELHYGVDWRIPIDKTWYYWFVPAKDPDYLKRDMNKMNEKGEIIF